ncbi:MAG: hypothetical protein ABI682_03515 [Acidobacteriota bacterium]
MIPTAARGLERLFGAALSPAVGALRVAALIALALVVLTALAGLASAVASRRYGWETGTVVRCRRCGRLAADPAQPACPEGHPVRFPSGAARREERRRAHGNSHLVFSSAAAVADGAIVVAALVGARAFRIADAAAPPLAAIAGAGGFLFLAGALLAAARAVSPAGHGPIGRVLAAVAGSAALAPALFFLVLTRAADPPAPRTLGSLWRTPAALYVSDGGKARRELPAGEPLEAEVVTVASAPLGFSWEGLSHLRAAGQQVPWRGRTGSTARTLERFPGVLGALGFSFSRGWRPVSAPVNERIWIVRGTSGIAFSTVADRDEGTAPDLLR